MNSSKSWSETRLEEKRLQHTIMKDVINMFQKMVEFCEKDDAANLSGRENALLKAAVSTTITDYTRTCYNKLKEKLMGYRGSGDVSTEIIDGTVKSSVGFTLLFPGKAATTLKSTAEVAYRERVILLNLSVRRRQWYTYDGLSLMEFLPVSCTNEPKSSEEST